MFRQSASLTHIPVVEPNILRIPDPCRYTHWLRAQDLRAQVRNRRYLKLLSCHPNKCRSTIPLTEAEPNSFANSTGSLQVRLPSTLSRAKHTSTPFLSAAPALSSFQRALN